MWPRALGTSWPVAQAVSLAAHGGACEGARTIGRGVWLGERGALVLIAGQKTERPKQKGWSKRLLQPFRFHVRSQAKCRGAVLNRSTATKPDAGLVRGTIVSTTACILEYLSRIPAFGPERPLAARVALGVAEVYTTQRPARRPIGPRDQDFACTRQLLPRNTRALTLQCHPPDCATAESHAAPHVHNPCAFSLSRSLCVERPKPHRPLRFRRSRRLRRAFEP